MKTLVISPRYRFWRLFLGCLITMLAALAATIVDAAPSLTPPNSRDFWVRNSSTSPTSFRKANAQLRAVGNRSLIYVEDKIWEKGVSSTYVNRLYTQLESRMPEGSYLPDSGIVPFEEGIFGSLPLNNLGDDRLVVLFADLSGANAPDGYFNSFDRVPDKEAMERAAQHSNESNIIYLNLPKRSDAYTSSVVARELQKLLAAASGVERESWLTETLASGAELLTGFFSRQSKVQDFAFNSGDFSLVTPSTPQGGAQILFGSFLLDSLPYSHNTAIGYVTKLDLQGRDAIESLFRDVTEAPPTFDAIFSNFVSYVFSHSEEHSTLPSSWHSSGLVMPKIAPYFTFRAGSGEFTGFLSPYSFVAIDLAHPLSPSVKVQVQRVPEGSNSDPRSCVATASVLWKPISATRLAVYAVGCDPNGRTEKIRFRLKIFDQPSK